MEYYPICLLVFGAQIGSFILNLMRQLVQIENFSFRESKPLCQDRSFKFYITEDHYSKSKLFPFALTLSPVFGAGIALNDDAVFRTSSSEPFLHLADETLATNNTALSDPFGIVAATIARRGISVIVDWLKLEKRNSMNL